MSEPGEVTQLLHQMRGGNREVEPQLIRVVYSELHRIAERHMRQERQDHSLQPTALVHEAYIRLSAGQDFTWKDRRHFFATAARSMRNILVDYARSRRADKRGAGARRLSLDDVLLFTEEKSAELLALEEALLRLEQMDPRQSQIVELKFFAGFTVPEVARLLELSPRTVEREWELARRWLYAEIATGNQHGSEHMATG